MVSERPKRKVGQESLRLTVQPPTRCGVALGKGRSNDGYTGGGDCLLRAWSNGSCCFINQGEGQE